MKSTHFENISKRTPAFAVLRAAYFLISLNAHALPCSSRVESRLKGATQQKGLFFATKTRTNYLKRSICYSGALLWNNLSQEIRNLPNLSQFKRATNDCYVDI